MRVVSLSTYYRIQYISSSIISVSLACPVQIPISRTVSVQVFLLDGSRVFFFKKKKDTYSIVSRVGGWVGGAGSGTHLKSVIRQPEAEVTQSEMRRRRICNG